MTDYLQHKNLASYRQSHLGENRGERYEQKMFHSKTYETAIWQLEKIILSRIIALRDLRNLLDFACGTGRVVSYLEDKVKNSYGVDISEDMVRVAKGKTKKTDFFIKDITRETTRELAEKFDLITAFRFFLNAEPDLRIKAMKAIEEMLERKGLLVFNIHQHRSSVNYFLARIKCLIKRKPLTANWLSQKEIKQFVETSHLEIRQIYSYVVLPRFLFRFLPKKVWFVLEKMLISKRIHWGSYLILVCQKENG